MGKNWGVESTTSCHVPAGVPQGTPALRVITMLYNSNHREVSMCRAGPGNGGGEATGRCWGSRRTKSCYARARAWARFPLLRMTRRTRRRDSCRCCQGSLTGTTRPYEGKGHKTQGGSTSRMRYLVVCPMEMGPRRRHALHGRLSQNTGCFQHCSFSHLISSLSNFSIYVILYFSLWSRGPPSHCPK